MLLLYSRNITDYNFQSNFASSNISFINGNDESDSGASNVATRLTGKQNLH